MSLGNEEEMEEVVCSGCGKTMPRSLEYCNNCGKRLPAVTQPEKAEIPQERAPSTEGWPMIRRDTAYTGSDGGPVHAPLEKVWEFQTGGSIESWPALAYDMVFFGSKDKHIYALDATTGQKKWSFKTGKKITTTPVVADGIVYVASEDKTLYAFDAQTGQQRWQFSSGKDISSPLAVGHSLVFFACKDKHIYAIDAQTGQKRWSYEGDNKNYSAPTIAEGKVLITGYRLARFRAKLYAIDADSGALAWKKKDYGATYVTRERAPCIVIGSNIVTLGPKDQVFMLDIASGAEKGQLFEGHAMVTKNESLLFIITNYVLLAIDLNRPQLAYTGSKWAAPIEEAFNMWLDLHPPAVGGEFAFVTVLKGKTLYGFNISKFMKRWEFQLDEPINSPPVLSNGMVFVNTDKGKIHAFKGATDPRATFILEHVAGEIAKKPKFRAILHQDHVIWPGYCCLCCGPEEKHISISRKEGQLTLSFPRVPYCETCRKKVKKAFGAEKPGAQLLKLSPRILGFRNEKYWAMFMETNRLR